MVSRTSALLHNPLVDFLKLVLEKLSKGNASKSKHTAIDVRTNIDLIRKPNISNSMSSSITGIKQSSSTSKKDSRVSSPVGRVIERKGFVNYITADFIRGNNLSIICRSSKLSNRHYVQKYSQKGFHLNA